MALMVVLVCRYGVDVRMMQLITLAVERVIYQYLLLGRGIAAADVRWGLLISDEEK